MDRLLDGFVEQIAEGKHPHVLLLRLEELAPGMVSLGAHAMGGQVYMAITFCLYGD